MIAEFNEKEIRIINTAVEDGNADQLYKLAMNYGRGENGYEQNKEKAFAFYLKALEKGKEIACYNVGLYYKLGRAIEKDMERAIYWLKKGVDVNERGCKYELGCLYLVGEDIEQDVEKAITLLEQSAKQGYLKAMIKMWEIYSEGAYKDDAKAFYWNEKAAHKGDRRSQFNMGFAYGTGKGGCEIDDERAVYWYTKAAEQGHRVAAFNLAIRYLEGTGTEANSESFFYWVTKSAELKYPKGYYHLALAYKDGTGTKKDLEKAKANAKNALEAGYEEAASLLEEVEGLEKAALEHVENIKKALKEKEDVLAENEFKALVETGYIAGIQEFPQLLEGYELNELEKKLDGFVSDEGHYDELFELGKRYYQRAYDCYERLKVREYEAKMLSYFLRASKGSKNAVEVLVAFYENGLWDDKEKYLQLKKL